MTIRTIFYLSDGTGITAETLGQSLITQFDNINFTSITIPYIDTLDKAQAAVLEINQREKKDGIKPIIFATLLDTTVKGIIATSEGILFEYFSYFLEPLSKELSDHSSQIVGRSHGIPDEQSYHTRIDAINFTLACDDGAHLDYYDEAELIVLGVSRSGKTPTCLYMALQFGIKVANYPMVEEDLQNLEGKTWFKQYHQKIYGLIIQPADLHKIRDTRWPNSEYASLKQCQWESDRLQEIYQRFNIPFLDTTKMSIEEISTKIMAKLGIKRKHV